MQIMTSGAPVLRNKIIAGILLAMAVGLTGSSCKNSNPVKAAGADRNIQGFTGCSQGMVNAVKTWQMPPELVEISGITWIDTDRAAAIQDEQGIIFIYNLKDERVEKQIDFGMAGDYEGISLVNGNYFVIRADGHLFEISDAGKIMNQYDLPLSVTDNIESFFYDARNNRLLIGQKDGPKDAGSKEIYSFDLGSRSFNATPVYSLDLSHPAITCLGSNATESENGTNGKKGKKKEKKNKASILRPSELAIHPISRDIYIADGPNQRILILTPDGTPKHFLTLDKQVHPKTEGLMFSPEGELYVSSEGVKNAGNISRVTITANN
jgi:uncharacterized protein YjiK